MDDTEDDARYPPNPYPPNHRRPLPSSHRPKLPVRNSSIPPQISGNYAADDDEDDEDEQNDIDHAMDEVEDDNDDDEGDDDYAGGYNMIRDDEDSSESRGKRRKLDNFEFAPRVVAGAPSVNPPPSRNLPADWSEGSTFVLLDAWGDLYLQNGRKSIRSDEWSEVSKKVSQASKTARSDVQCRNRVDTLKKKYKKEKARMEEAVSSNSEWVYFKKMDALMSSSPSPPPPLARQQQEQPPRLPCGVDAGGYVFSSSRVYLNRSNGMDEMRDSPGDTGPEDDDDYEDNESDGLPPKRLKVAGSSESSFRMLADSIQKFGETYEKIENSKRQQMADLERMRKEFQKDLELQKRQILERAQEEIAKIRQEEGEEEEEGEERTEDEDGNDDENDAST